MFGLGKLGRMGAGGLRTLAQKVRSLFSRLSPNGHMYIGGAGGVVTNGFQPGNYVESAGTTLASTDGPVGLVLDAAVAVGSELIVNGSNITTTTGLTPINATLSVVSGSIRVTATAGSARLSTPISCIIGDTYTVSITFSAKVSTGNIFFQVGDFAGSGDRFQWNVGTQLGTYSRTFVATQTTHYIGATSSASIVAGETYDVTSISSKQITGIHASQATVGSKPMLRKGIVNLLTWSNTFSNAAWLVQGTASKSGNDLLTPAAGDRVIAGATVSSGAITVAFVLSGTGTASIYAFNATDGNIGIRQITLTSEPTLYVTTATATVANTSALFARRIGDTATSITFGGAGLFQGTLTAQQIRQYGGIPLTGSAAASSSLGPQYLAFDGVDDSLESTFAAGTLPANADVFMTVRKDTSGNLICLYDVPASASNFIGVLQPGNFSACVSGAGAAWSVFVDGVQVGGVNTTTRDQLYAAFAVGSFHILEIRNVNLSAWAALAAGFYSAGFSIKGAIAFTSITPALTDSERTLMRTQAAKAAGGRLVNGAFVSDF